MKRMDEKGVSPVIGVILMVAITVILAAVIASFVFGMGTRLEPVKTPGFTVKRINGSAVEVTLTSMGGATAIDACNVTAPSGVTPSSSIEGTGSTDTWTVGETVTLTGVSEGNRLVITCQVDGKQQVVLDTTV